MKWLNKIWLWIRWPIAVLVVFYIVVVIYRIPAVGERQRTDEAVAKIQAQKITFSDVMGDVLPPTPNQQENDATVAGIDKNNNGIRDDVELAIFKLHPTSAKIRAAELQYAMDQQIMMTDVFNSQTWIAAAQQNSRGYQCVGNTLSRQDLQKHLENTDTLTKEIKDAVLNTSARQTAWHNAYNFTTTYGDLTVAECDIDLNTLPN
jgi:hypothetical protein